ncbi:MAG: sensor histidine kinase [Proteobacteria bacterium]|nr:sensor histidine kinase [Pseudomonadota bacterium]
MAVTAAVAPVLLLAAWAGVEGRADAASAREAAARGAADRVLARGREVLEASHRMLLALCADSSVRASAGPEAAAADFGHCEAYLGSVLKDFPDQYSAAVVTGIDGVVRCANVPTAVGISLADRDVFQRVRDARRFAIGEQMASRVTPHAIVPVGLPVLQGDQFRGICALGISMRGFADGVAPANRSPGAARVSVVDRLGNPVEGEPEVTRALPVSARVATAIRDGTLSFRDVGQDGQAYLYRLVPLAGAALHAVTATAQPVGVAALGPEWLPLGLVVLAWLASLVALWFGADRWCVQPLRSIRDFADRVARGEDIELVARRPWGPELASVGDGVRAMAAAIASREAELKAGLEQRDHMLREIHHRVKNNLQMISSLLNLQAGEIRSPRIRRFFGDAQNRVLTLSILHRHLYERSSWALVDFQQFISDLVRQISVGRRGPDRPSPRFHIRAPIMAVGPDTAIPIGLIVTEAVGSALNRARDGSTTPEIRIEAADRDGTVELVIEDNGPGLDRSLGPGTRGGFGLTLIRGLAMQLGGEAKVLAREPAGMWVVVTFPMPRDPDPHD